VGCQPVMWHLSDSIREACQELRLCDPLGMGLRRISPYGTQVAGLRVDTTSDVGSSGKVESGHHPRFL